MSAPTADVSVRVAWASDAGAIAAVQVNAWQQAYTGLLPVDLLSSLPAAEMAEQWKLSIERPGEARQRVLVALERAAVRGFAAIAPATDDDASPATDAELVEFVVDPSASGAGHGSRLLHAAVDTMRSDGFRRATLWVNAPDDALRSFLAAQGWDADGAYRELDLHADGSVLVKQVRLHTDLSTS